MVPVPITDTRFVMEPFVSKNIWTSYDALIAHRNGQRNFGTRAATKSLSAHLIAGRGLTVGLDLGLKSLTRQSVAIGNNPHAYG